MGFKFLQRSPEQQWMDGVFGWPTGYEEKSIMGNLEPTCFNGDRTKLKLVRLELHCI